MISLELPCVIPFRAPQRKGNSYFNPLDKERQDCKWIIKSQYSGMPILGPVRAYIEFCIEVPASSSRKRKEELLGQEMCLKKIDLDNLSKFALDVIKGIVIEDDSQIWHLTAMKCWSKENKTVIHLWQSPND